MRARVCVCVLVLVYYCLQLCVCLCVFMYGPCPMFGQYLSTEHEQGVGVQRVCGVSGKAWSLLVLCQSWEGGAFVPSLWNATYFACRMQSQPCHAQSTEDNGKTVGDHIFIEGAPARCTLRAGDTPLLHTVAQCRRGMSKPVPSRRIPMGMTSSVHLVPLQVAPPLSKCTFHSEWDRKTLPTRTS